MSTLIERVEKHLENKRDLRIERRFVMAASKFLEMHGWKLCADREKWMKSYPGNGHTFTSIVSMAEAFRRITTPV